ncbi:MAG: CAP domain-containing protein [Paraclostridium sp.]|uniref:CAP domain-containing protein n=1 Tax=Paraclostridium sp. TaxID=2023273 RepID=UPI003F2D5B47
MNKKLKTLLSLGVVSVLSACATFPVNAASNETVNKKIYCNNNSYNEYMCVNVQGKDCYTPVKPMSTLIQELLKNKSNCLSKNIHITTNTTQSKLEENSTSKPETPSTENKPSTPDVDVNVPQNKPEGNTNSKPENKPETPSTENKPSTPSGNFASFQQEVLSLVNVERTNRGLQPLKFSSELSKVATLKSQDMIDKNYFDHTSPTYGSPFDMMKQFGISYNAAGENIAMGQETPKEVMNSWMNSSGHRKNILNPDFTELGVGIASNGSSLYWTQMFIGK